MARMTREFSLVLVGSGVLTTGYFVYPDEDLEARQKEQVEQQLAGNAGNANGNPQHARHPYRVGYVWLHPMGWSSGGYSSSRPPAMGGGHVSRGGFGGIGRGSVGG
jgi:hypothetical protein